MKQNSAFSTPKPLQKAQKNKRLPLHYDWLRRMNSLNLLCSSAVERVGLFEEMKANVYMKRTRAEAQHRCHRSSIGFLSRTHQSFVGCIYMFGWDPFVCLCPKITSKLELFRGAFLYTVFKVGFLLLGYLN